MNVQDLLIEAATLMGTGMLVVFVFLTILIYAVKLLAVLGKIFPDPVQAPRANRISNNPKRAGQIPQQVVAAITAAVHQHKNQAK